MLAAAFIVNWDLLDQQVYGNAISEQICLIAVCSIPYEKPIAFAQLHQIREVDE